MDSSGDSTSSSNLSLNLKVPFFKPKFPCEGFYWPQKKKKRKPKAPPKAKSVEDVQSIRSHEISWLSKNKHFCKLAFDEKLTVFKTMDKMVGEAVINVHLTSDYDYLLHFNWKLFDVECFPNPIFDIISFTSLIRKSLVTQEEKYCNIDTKKQLENHLYVCEKMDSYYVVPSTVNKKKILTRKYHDYCFTEYKDILTKGSMILLLRQLTILDIRECDPLHLLLEDGSLSNVTFELEDFQCVTFDNKIDILVKKITASITQPQNGQLLERITTLLSQNGRIVYQEWKFKGIVLRFDPRKDIKFDYCSHQPSMGKPSTTIPLEEVWRQDMQLNSMYHQEKKDFKREYEKYYESNPVLGKVLRDYMKDVLMFKPEDPVDYTIRYFYEMLL
ncbi:hypothetical protein WDU94_001169 [Cyamophila willieti]